MMFSAEPSNKALRLPGVSLARAMPVSAPCGVRPRLGRLEADSVDTVLQTLQERFA